MTDLLEARRQSHEFRRSTQYDVSITDQGVDLMMSPDDMMMISEQPVRTFAEDMSILGENIVDTGAAAGRAVLGGVRDAGQGFLDLTGELADLLESKVPLGYITYGPDGLSWQQEKPEGYTGLQLPEVPRGDSVVENIGRGLVQFAAGFAAAPIRGAGIVSNMARGGFADALFDPEDGNLSTFLKSMGLENDVINYLDSEVGADAEAEERLRGRLKNSLEGLAIGGLLDSTMSAFKAARSDDGIKETIRKGLISAGDNAQARLDEAGSGTTLSSGFDPTGPVDEALVAARNALLTREEKGARRVSEIAAADATNKTGRPKVVHVQQYVDEFAVDRHGRSLDQYDDADFATAVTDAASEIRYQLTTPTSGKGWYDKDIVMTFDMASQIPGLESLRDNETHRVIWSAVAGATSNGNKVPLNSKIATAQMLEYFKNGKFLEAPPAPGSSIQGIPDAGFGRRGPAVAKALKLINFLIEKYGEEGFADWWLSPHSLAELTALRKEAGFSGPPSGLSGGKDAMFIGARILGDKTGQFSLNINGLEGTTKDVWFTRGYHRYFGTLGDASKTDRYGEELTQPRNATERRRMEEFVRQVQTELSDLELSEQDIQAIMWYYEQALYTDLGVRSIPESFSEGIGKLDGQAGISVQRGDADEITAEPGTTLPGFRDVSTKQRTVRSERRLADLNRAEGDETPSGPYTATSGTDDGAGRVLEPNPAVQARYETAGLNIPRITQADASTSQQYHDDMVAAMAGHPMGAQVEIKSAEELSGMQLFRTEGGSGFAIKPDGDVVAVFAGPGDAKGSSYAMLQAAVDMGGKKLDAFNTYLPDIYETVGFRPVSRLKWNDAFAPDNWDKETFKEFQNGEPDVVFFVYDPNYFGDADYDSLPVFTDYDEAAAVQDKVLRDMGGE